MPERHLTLVKPLADMACPLCGKPLAAERFYGPCDDCREGLRNRAHDVGEKAKLVLAKNQEKKAEDDRLELERIREQQRNAPPKPWEKRQQRQWQRR